MIFTVERLCYGLIPTEKQKSNLDKLCIALNKLFEHIDDEFRIVAGLLTKEGCIGKGEKETSPLIDGEAVILEDKGFRLSEFLLNNLHLLQANGLYLKNPVSTISTTMTQQISEKCYMANYIFLQTKPMKKVIFNEWDEEL
jgi:hypothetical protein